MAITYGKNYGRPTLDLNFAENKSLIDSVTGRNLITFSRSQSGKEATYVGSDGLIKYAGADEPRFDYNPVSGVCKGILIEESRTNLCTFSEDFTGTDWAWQGTSGTITSGFSSPAGNLTASKLITSSNTSGRRKDLAPKGVSGVTNSSVSFNLLNGEYISTIVGSPTYGSESVSNGWYRYWITASGYTYSIYAKSAEYTQIQLQAFNQFFYVYAPEAVGGNTTDGILIWGAQVEAGAFPTSYIPTSGSTVTRPADNASITGTNFSSWYNQSEGTIFAGVSSFSYNNSATLPTFAHFTDGSLNNYIRLNSGPAYLVRNFTNTGGVTQTQSGVSYIAPANNSPYSIALGLTTNNARIYANGNPAALINPYSPPVVNKVEIGNWIAQNNTWTNGHLSRLTYWPKRLPDLELQQLTK